MFPKLYAIMDAALLYPEAAGQRIRPVPSEAPVSGARWSPLESAERIEGKAELAFAEMLAQSGVKLIQYRHKQASSRRLLEISKQLQSLLGTRGVRLVVNDRADVAAVGGAGGVHLGQLDLPVEAARRICGSGCWVGLSTHSLEQLRAADQTSADYLAVGPIFETSTKEKPDPVVGIEFVRQARSMTRKPLVAIGGITLERAEAVFRAGADSVAVARDLIGAPDPALRARGYLALADALAAGRG